MNGELAQLICLASYGSAWLAAGGRQEPPALDRDNSTFQFVGSVVFRFDETAPGQEPEAADDVARWLLGLRERDVARLWLVLPEPRPVTGPGTAVTDEHMLAGFANAGRQSLLAACRDRPETWRAAWTVGDPRRLDRRIWSVDYRGGHADSAAPQRPDLAVAGQVLAEALRAAKSFAAGQDLPEWAGWFDRALAGDGSIPVHPDMLPPGWPEGQRHLAAMAAQAWVFGGMGSWNDLTFGDPGVEAEYGEVSRCLYAAVLAAFAASVNGAA